MRLARTWGGWVAVAALALAATDCSSKSSRSLGSGSGGSTGTGGQGPEAGPCARLNARLEQCDVPPEQRPPCDPNNELDVCHAVCLIEASCEAIRPYLLGDIDRANEVDPRLEECHLACDPGPVDDNCMRAEAKYVECGIPLAGLPLCDPCLTWRACSAGCLANSNCQALTAFWVDDDLAGAEAADPALTPCLLDCADFAEPRFVCDDRVQTIPRDWMCDGGTPDCDDGSDEALCEFVCLDGMLTVPATRICDSIPDCCDGSDELCDEAAPGT